MSKSACRKWTFVPKDAVRVTSTDGGFNARLLPTLWALPEDAQLGPEGKRDQAMIAALTFHTQGKP